MQSTANLALAALTAAVAYASISLSSADSDCAPTLGNPGHDDSIPWPPLSSAGRCGGRELYPTTSPTPIFAPVSTIVLSEDDGLAPSSGWTNTGIATILTTNPDPTHKQDTTSSSTTSTGGLGDITSLPFSLTPTVSNLESFLSIQTDDPSTLLTVKRGRAEALV